MYKHIKVDTDLCIGCKTCMAACVVSHTGNRIFAMSPDSFDFTPRIHITRTSSVTKPNHCRQCPTPQCMAACPFNCIFLGERTVVIDEDACRGCGKCARACPFDAILMTRIVRGNTQGRAFRLVALKCDLCANTIKGTPACIDACPTEALTLFTPQAPPRKKKKR